VLEKVVTSVDITSTCKENRRRCHQEWHEERRGSAIKYYQRDRNEGWL